ncbi:MAG: hypothetical protein G01um101433_25 [Parcubacteria group bacterium Gr01-1014_33]|nr:MAG: hypothetical protein G01um101433_25 [Parcubacteria group bacterium Gr01-1014_33]
MKTDTKNYSSSGQYEPPAGLFEKIIARIRKEERLLIIKKRILLFSSGVFVSAGACIPALIGFRQEFAESGFFQFLSLMFSDSAAIGAHWQDFLLAILESLPVMSISALLAILLAFLWMLKYCTRAIQGITISTHTRQI